MNKQEIKEYLLKRVFKGKLLASGFSVVCCNYAFSISEGEVKDVYIGNKGNNGITIFTHLLTYEQMKNLVG